MADPDAVPTPAPGVDVRAPLVVAPLHATLPDALGPLLADDAQAGTRHVRRLADEWASGVNRFDRPGETLLGAWFGGELVGVCGLNVDPYAGHDRVGRVRRLYVLSARRRLGVGRRLVTEVVAAARGRFDLLRLSTTSAPAAGLYEALGFRRVEGVPDCTHLMVLEPGGPLSAGPSPPAGERPRRGTP
jgi:GNAT superfamily N-acetyltransferase